MKKLFIAIFLILAIAFIGLFVFAITFDANKYKGALTERIEEAIDRDVRIGNISLSVFPNLAFRVNGLSVKDRDGSWSDAMLNAGSIDADLKLMPLLRKDIQAENIIITDATVRYADKNYLPAGIKIDIVEAIIKNASLYGPVNVKARLSVFGRGVENTSMKAVVYPEINTGKPFIKNLEAIIELDKFNIADCLSTLGMAGMAAQLTDKEVKGKLRINSEKLDLDPKEIYNSTIFIALSEAMTNALPVKEALNSVELKAEIKSGDLIIQALTGKIANGAFSIKGLVKDMFLSQETDMDVLLQDVDVARLLSTGAHGKPGFGGLMGVSAHISTTGFKGLDTLTSSGNIKIDKAILKDINILTAALEKIEILPGLVSKLMSKLPERYKEMLKDKDTSFKPISLNFSVKNGAIMFRDARIESDAFYLTGSGYFGLNSDLNIHSNIFIPKDLSGALIEVVRELSYLQNAQGLITMPMDIEGKYPNIYIKPDLDYVIQKLAVAKGQELLEGLFKKSQPAETKPHAEDAAKQQVSAEPEKKQEEVRPEEAIIKAIFDIIRSPKE